MSFAVEAQGRLVSELGHVAQTNGEPAILNAEIPHLHFGLLDKPVFLEVAPNVFAWYAHLRQGSLTVKVGGAVKAGGAHRQVKKHWPFATGNPGLPPQSRCFQFQPSDHWF